MKYLTTITTLVALNIFAVIALIYFGNNSRLIEEENRQLKFEILQYSEQLKINEVEYNLYNNYSYLKKLQKIYTNTEKINLLSGNRIFLKDFENRELKNVYFISSN